MLVDWNARFGLLGLGLGGSRTALLRTALLSRTRAQTCSLLRTLLLLLLLKLRLRPPSERLHSRRRLALTLARPTTSHLSRLRSIRLSVSALERAHDRRLGALLLLGLWCGGRSRRGRRLAAEQQLRECALLFLLWRRSVHRVAVRAGHTRGPVLAELRGDSTRLRRHPWCLAGWVSLTGATRRHLPSLLSSRRPETRLVGLLAGRALALG